MKSAITLGAALAILVTGLEARADKVYRWVDDKGGVHYAATPPPGMAVPPSELEYTHTPDPAAAAQQMQQYQKDIDQRRADASEAEKASVTEAGNTSKRAQRCNEARSIVERLRNGVPGTRYRNEDGSYTRSDGADRDQKIADAETAIKESCN